MTTELRDPATPTPPPVPPSPSPAVATPLRGRPPGKSETRARLLQTAIDLIEEDPDNPLGLRDVTRRAGVTQGAPYRYFKDRAALIAAVAEYGFGRLQTASLKARDRAGDDPLRRLHALGAAYLSFAIAQPGLFRVMFGGDSREVQAVRTAEAACLALCTEAITAAQAAARLRPGDPQRLAILCWSTMHGLASLVIDGLVAWVGLQATPGSLGQTLLTQLFDGLRPRTDDLAVATS